MLTHIRDAYITNGANGAIWELPAYDSTATPDDLGYYPAYLLAWPYSDPDRIDWDNPDSVEDGHGYSPTQNRFI